MAAPSSTLNQEIIGDGSGGVTTLAASGSTTGNLDITAKYEAQFQIRVDFGGSAANSVTVNLYRAVDSTSSPTFDSEPAMSFDISESTSTTKRDTTIASTGMWQVELVNNDGSNSVDVLVLAATVDSIA